MKLVLVGVGSFGGYWYHILKSEYKDLQVVVVDKDEAAAERVGVDEKAFYTDLEEAVEKEKPDFVLNATPPHIHKSINDIAFKYRLPVLCEKPISDSYEEAVEMVGKSEREGVPFMIAENYRTHPFMRKARKLIQEGIIGEIASVDVSFYKKFYTDKEYFIKMQDPLLVDVTIHHLDTMRYLTGSETKRLFARNFNPKGSWFPGNMNTYMLLEMENGAVITYTGSMVAGDRETDWSGDWRIQGTEGIMTISSGYITVIKDGQETLYERFDDIAPKSCLDEFILSLKEHRKGETAGTDYIRTQALVHIAQESSRLGKMLEVE